MNILIVDDDKGLHYSFKRFLHDEGHAFFEAYSGEEARDFLLKRKDIHLVFMDIMMGGISGLDALKVLRREGVTVPIILMTAYGTTKRAIEAMKFGAFDYIIKPFDLDVLKSLIKKVQEAFYSHSILQDTHLKGEDLQDGIIGESSVMQEIYKTIGKVASSEATVLITGESGTGKEVIAWALHRHSPRADKPFIPVNCAAITETILESELFGHEKGAFTGADALRRGIFEEAHGGMIFLDEIGDMTLNLQSKLLRVLQDGTFMRVGSHTIMKTDVVLVAATNKDLEKGVGAGTFRKDLYYRLNVVHIHMPALCERLEDIPLLVEYFTARNRHIRGGAECRFSEKAIAALKKYQWPGNVRQLENTVKRALVFAKSSVITDIDIRHVMAETGHAGETLHSGGNKEDYREVLLNRARNDKNFQILPHVEKEFIQRVMEATGGNIQQSAAMLGMTRNTLKKRLKDIEKVRS